MDEKPDDKVAVEFSARCAEARACLERTMVQRGLLAKDGWRITETVRTIIGGTEIVMRPLHLYRASPEDLECVVRVMEHSGVESRCGDPSDGPRE